MLQLSLALVIPMQQLQRVSLDIMEILVINLANFVVPVPRQIPEQVLGHQRVLHVPLVCIRHHRTLVRVQPVPPVPRQIPEQVLGQ